MPRAKRRRNPKTPPLVIVEWVDAEGSGDWINGDEELQEFLDSSSNVVRTVGWLIRRTKDYLVLASTMAQDEGKNDTNRIPSGMVKKVINLYA